MIDLKKQIEFFDPSVVAYPIHVVGCGAIGSNVCEQLARLGLKNIHIWDFDTVANHNIANQNFKTSDIGKPKVKAISEMMTDINADLEKTLVIHNEPIKAPWILNGYIIMCVDNIDVRKEIVKANRFNPNCEAILDFRMRLTDAQHYAAKRERPAEMTELLKTMNFTQEEADAATPVSACGTTLSVVYTPKTIVSLGIANLVKIMQDEEYFTKILFDAKFMDINAF